MEFNNRVCLLVLRIEIGIVINRLILRHFQNCIFPFVSSVIFIWDFFGKGNCQFKFDVHSISVLQLAADWDNLLK